MPLIETQADKKPQRKKQTLENPNHEENITSRNYLCRDGELRRLWRPSNTCTYRSDKLDAGYNDHPVGQCHLCRLQLAWSFVLAASEQCDRTFSQHSQPRCVH